MVPIGKETTDFVRACEAIHALLAIGRLTPDERISSSSAAVSC